QTLARRLTLWDEIRIDTEFAQGACRLLADRRDLDPGERAGIQAVLLELLAHRADRVDRGEGHPLVASGDQALDGTLHLLRGTRRLDGDRGDLFGHRAVRLQPL